jgi:hypothetical protein
MLCLQKATRAKAKKVLDALLDPYVVLGMACLNPLLDCINTLVKFAQAQNVYICDFVATFTNCQGQLFEMYLHKQSAFATHNFIEFRQMVECRHEQIHVKWDLDMNESVEVLTFTIGAKILQAKYDDAVITKEAWLGLILEVKAECASKLFPVVD